MIPLTGTVSLAALRAEFGLGTAPVPSFLGLASVRRAANIPAGTVKISDLRGAHVVKAGTTVLNLFAAMGNPAAVSTRYRVVVEPGATIGSANPLSYSADTGQFPAGSTLTIDLYGSVDGAGGLFGVQGGRGGGSIYAQYPNQTVNVNVKPGGALRPGGGAGGQGGQGGAGGQGGIGLVTEGPVYQTTAPRYEVAYSVEGAQYSFYWAGTLIGITDTGQTSLASGSTTYYADSFQGNTGVDNSSKGGANTIVNHFAIRRTTPGGPNGGAGGAGGGGGGGGRGQGFDGVAAGGAGGAPGAGGGGSNGNGSGVGGAGGAGGPGGAGGGFGADGAAGGASSGGNPGGAGSGGGGFAAAGPNAGLPGGPRGYYVFKGTATVNVNNQGGTILGALG